MEECLLSLSLENRAVLLLFKNILVSLPEEFYYIYVLLPLPKADSAFSYLMFYTFVSQRSVSGTSLSLTLNSTYFWGF